MYMTHKNLPKIVERRLGKERCWGLCWYDEKLIEIDPRQNQRQYLNTLIHEMLHLFFEDLSETTVKSVASKMSTVIWNKKYRKTK